MVNELVILYGEFRAFRLQHKIKDAKNYNEDENENENEQEHPFEKKWPWQEHGREKCFPWRTVAMEVVEVFREVGIRYI